MNKILKAKLANLPNSPGVYFHKNQTGEIIYIGKAANLKNRVRQYFQASRWRDPKTDLLVSEITNTDWMVLGSEAEALFVEAELVKRYLPKYNILLRDDKSSIFICINLKDQAPSVTTTRRPLDDNANYWGPFLQAGAVNKALRHLRKAFPYSTHRVLPNRACLDCHLGLCPGPETANYDRNGYIDNLKKLILFIEGKSQKVVKALETEMQSAAKKQQFEIAARLRNQLRAIKALQTQIIFGDSEALDLSKDYALADLAALFKLKSIPRHIEGYDISHWQGSDNVASLVVFKNGAPDKTAYRKFKLRLVGNDDYAHLQEVICRRFQPKNIKDWGLPDFVMIDGGKGQLAIVAKEISKLGLKIPVIGLAKRFEEIIILKNGSFVAIDKKTLNTLKGSITSDTSKFITINLPANSHAIKLLQRLRDESHRFAISYQASLKVKRQSTSQIDAVSGIGAITKKKLLKSFGSLRAISGASETELAKIVGPNKAKIVRSYISDDIGNS